MHRVELVHVGTLNWLKLDLSRFDIIVFHYSIAIARGFHLRPELRSRLAAAKAMKVLFIQDEYRWIDATADAIRELGIAVLFSVVNRDVVEKIYHHPWLKDVRKEVTLTGFVDENLLQVRVPRYSERAIDVSYRARKVPYWLGAFAMEKWVIGRIFKAEAAQYQLRCDISSEESARLYGDKWIHFLSNTRAVLGTESGASVCDFSGKLKEEVDAALALDPDATFESIQEKILREDDGKIVINVISPRVFEAAALRTLMINYPGEYSGRLVPWRHFCAAQKGSFKYG